MILALYIDRDLVMLEVAAKNRRLGVVTRRGHAHQIVICAGERTVLGGFTCKASGAFRL